MTTTAAQHTIGDRVRVRRAFPPGHFRTPAYVRGRTGVIVTVIGTFPDPEELAYGRDGMPGRTLYRVRFNQTDLWTTPDPGPTPWTSTCTTTGLTKREAHPWGLRRHEERDEHAACPPATRRRGRHPAR